MSVRDAADALAAAVATADVRVYRDPGAAVDPPAVIVGPPTLGWEAFAAAPTTARFPLWVVVAASEFALPALWELVPRVAAAAEAMVSASLLDGPAAATPTTYHSGGVELPAYEMTIEVAL